MKSFFLPKVQGIFDPSVSKIEKVGDQFLRGESTNLKLMDYGSSQADVENL